MVDKEDFLRDMESMLDRKNQSLETKINNNTDTQFSAMRKQMLEFSRDNEPTKAKVNNHESRLTNIEKKNNIQESADRNLNIIMFGIKESTYGEVLSKAVGILQELVPEVNRYCIKNVFKLNKDGWNSDGPIKISLTSSLLKNDIMRSKFKLQGREIRITEDLPEEFRETRKKLVPYSLAEKNKGNKVFMRRDTLVINGKAWTLSELKQREAEQMDVGNAKENIQNAKNGGNTVNTLKRAYEAVASPCKSKPDSAKKNKTDPRGSGSNQVQKNLTDMWAKPIDPKEVIPNNNKDTTNKENV